MKPKDKVKNFKGVFVTILSFFSSSFAVFIDGEDANVLNGVRGRRQWIQISKPQTNYYQPNKTNNTNKFSFPHKPPTEWTGLRIKIGAHSRKSLRSE